MSISVEWGHQSSTTSVTWLWKPFIAFGNISLLRGKHGSGKTLLMSKIAAMISKGCLPLEGEDEKQKPMNVFYGAIRDEITDSILRQYTNNGGDSSHFAFINEYSSRLTLSYSEIIDIYNQTKAKLIVIDPIQHFFAEHNSNKVKNILHELSRAAMETGSAIVIIDNSSYLDPDLFHSAFSISTTNRLNIRQINSLSHHYSKPIYTLLDGNNQLDFIPTPKHTAKIDQAQQYLQEILSNGPVESNELKKLCADAGISQSTRNRAKALINVKSFWRDGHSYWKLP